MCSPSQPTVARLYSKDATLAPNPSMRGVGAPMDGLSALPWTARWCLGTLPCENAKTTFCWMSLLIVKLNRDFHRAGDIQRSDARIYLPDDDNAGVWILRAIIPIEDGHVRTRGPINHLANFVSVGSSSLLRNRTRQTSK